jgi:hypothetical protein
MHGQSAAAQKRNAGLPGLLWGGPQGAQPPEEAGLR